MFHVDNQFGKNISCHVIHPDELEHDQPIHDAFPNIMVSDVNVFGHSVIDGVPSKKVSSTIVDVQDCWSWDLFFEFGEEATEPN